MSNPESTTSEQLKELADEVEQMEADITFLQCLQACGLDSWEGYEEAQNMMDNMK